MPWREARALLRLLEQVNQKWPNRSKLSDGELGDTSHSARISDHNPNAEGVVCALDVTNDPNHGLVSRQLAEELIHSQDNRIKYIISNREIASGPSGPSPWKWRQYNGLNPHEHHMHISVRSTPNYYDDDRPWDLSGVDTRTILTSPIVSEIGSAKWLQHELIMRGYKLQEDGYEGTLTQAAIRAFAVDTLKGVLK